MGFSHELSDSTSNINADSTVSIHSESKNEASYSLIFSFKMKRVGKENLDLKLFSTYYLAIKWLLTIIK